MAGTQAEAAGRGRARRRGGLPTVEEDGGQVPAVGQAGGRDGVLGQRDHGAVVEHGQQHDQDGGEVPARRAAVRCSAAAEVQIAAGGAGGAGVGSSPALDSGSEEWVLPAFAEAWQLGLVPRLHGCTAL